MSFEAAQTVLNRTSTRLASLLPWFRNALFAIEFGEGDLLRRREVLEFVKSDVEA